MTAYNSAVLADSPVRYWTLDDSTGTDTQGNGNLIKGPGAAAPTAGAAGATTGGTSWTYDGNDYTQFSTPTITTAFTFECFFKTTGSGNGAGGSHTLFRSDNGGPVALIRIQDVGNTVNPGKVMCLFGGSPVFYSTGTVNDDNWHHLALTLSGTTAKLYLDGTLNVTATTDTSSYSFNTTSGLGFDNYGTPIEYFKGNLDEVAIYNTALSSTRVAAHYAARAAVNGGYTAQAATSTATMPGGVYSKSTNYAASAATASGLMTSALAATKVASVTVDDSDMIGTAKALSGVAFPGTADTALAINADIGGLPEQIVFLKALASLPEGAILGSATLSLNLGLTNSITFKVQSADADFSTSTTNWNTKPAYGAVQTPSKTFSTTGTKTFDVTEIARAISAGTAYGYALVPSAGGNLVQTGNGGTTAPVLTLTYWAPAVTQISPTPFTASAVMVSPVVSFINSVNCTAEPGVLTAEMPGGNYSSPLNYTATVATASAAAVQASVTTEHNAVVLAPAATLSGFLNAPEEARNPMDDPYFVEVRNSTDGDDVWYRLDETSGTIARAYEGGTGNLLPESNASIVGSVGFNVYGPEGRKAFHFTDGYLNHKRDLQVVNEYTFETVIRTTQKDGLLAYGLDNVIGGNTFRNSIFLKNGKVTIDFAPPSSSGAPPGPLSGFKDVADGQWHHIVVAFGYGNRILDTGYRVYVDGKLDIRREAQGSGYRFAVPDYFFGAPAAERYNGQAPNFVGDVMEVVYRQQLDLNQNDAQQLYYDAMGIQAIPVEAATASAEMPEAYGKGNQKRALVLYFEAINNGPFVNNAGQTYVGEYQSNPDKGDFEFGALIPTPGQIGYEEKLVAQGYRLFYTSVNLNGAFQYRDPVTDLPVLLDLTKDGIPEQFDLIFYRNFPNEGTELDNLFAQGFDMQDLEDHLASLRRCVDAGISLWVSDPYLASLLGIIDRVELISTLREDKTVPEQGDNQDGLWDEHSAAIYPWSGQGGPAYTWYDTHRNNKERVVASIDGMTDVPGEVITDALFFTPSNIYSWAMQPHFKYEERPNGLLIGDEYLEQSMTYNDYGRWSGYSAIGFGQYMTNMYAVPPGAVKAGTVVTKLGSKLWAEGNVEIDNPYKDYAGTIVVKPGDSLKGRQVGGKILFTISEDPRFALFENTTFKRQLVPPNEQIVDPAARETDEQRSWDYSATRVLMGSKLPGQTAGGGVIVAREDEDGNMFYIVGGKDVNSVDLVPLVLSEKYPVEVVKIKNMIQRGLEWLGIREVTNAGDKVIRADAATGAGEMPSPVVTAQKSVSVHAEVALGNGTMVSPVGYGKDVTVIAFPATMSGVMVNYERKIVVGPFEATGVMVDPLSVTAQRDTIVLTIQEPRNIILYLEEN